MTVIPKIPISVADEVGSGDKAPPFPVSRCLMLLVVASLPFRKVAESYCICWRLFWRHDADAKLLHGYQLGVDAIPSRMAADHSVAAVGVRALGRHVADV